MPFFCHATKVECVHWMHYMLQTDISSESNVADLSCCSLPCPFRSFYSIQKVKTRGVDLELEVRHNLKGLLVGLHKMELFGVPPARRGLGCTAAPTFWHDLGSPHWFFVATLLYFTYFSGLLISYGTSLTSRVHRLVMLEFAVLTIG